MNQALPQLLDAMNAEITFYKDMLDILAKEYDAAMKSDRDRLKKMGQLKQKLVQDIGQTEKKRRELVDRLGEIYRIRERPITVDRLCPHLDALDASRLKTCAGELKKLIETVRKKNNANARLFSHALELVHSSLKLIDDLICSHSIYEKPGSKQRSKGYGTQCGRVFCGSV